MNESTPKLWREHEEVLRARAIPVEYAVAAGLESVDLSAWKADQQKYHLKKTFPGLPYHPVTGILIPYHDCLDNVPRARVRADNTKVILAGPEPGSHMGEHEAEIPRYICQAGVPVAPYITREVFEIAGDTKKPIYIVEAPLKALCLSAHGYPAIGLGGVLAGVHDRDALKEVQEIVAHKELRRIDWRGRTAYVVFDAGVNDNPMVALGAAYAAHALGREGARIRLVSLPYYHPQDSDPENGKLWFAEDQGPDDFIARNAVESFQTLVVAASPMDPVSQARAAVDENAGASRAEAVVRLLAELPFQAMLHVGGQRVIDSCAAVTSRIGVGKKSYRDAADEIQERLARRVKRDQPEWRTDLRLAASGTPRPLTLNVETCLRGDPDLKDLVAWDDFLQTVVFTSVPPWVEHYAGSRGTVQGSPWTDDDDTRLQAHLGRKHDILDVPTAKIQAAVTVVAKDKPYHPVREYLKSLTWDGVNRLDTWAQIYLGASANLADYHAIVTPKWFISAVARVQQPGCKVDHTMVLEGEQGDHKTEALRILGGEWFSDASQDDLASKEAAMKLQGAWVFVFDEGSILSRTDAVQMKEFLTKQDDDIVPKFSNRKVRLKRQCAFALTTNDDNYLSDHTGNRRYWPITSGGTDVDALRRDRDQLWAEALHRYSAGELWWPTKEQEAIIRVEQDKRRHHDPWEPKIAAGLIGKVTTTVEHVLSEILEIKVKDEDQRSRLRVVRVLRVLGWRFDKVAKVDGVSCRIYVPRAPSGEKLEPSRKLTTSQEAMALAFQKALGAELVLEALPDGTVLRVWREPPCIGAQGLEEDEDLYAELLDRV